MLSASQKRCTKRVALFLFPKTVQWICRNNRKFVKKNELTDSTKIAHFATQLSPFLPEQTTHYVAEFLIDNVVHFTISKSRATKLGDYRHPYKGSPHRISVNGDLNPFAFLITTLHEMAHLTTYVKYQNRVKPHGTQWKNEFKLISAPVLDMGILPHDITLALTNYLKDAKASSCTDDRLYRVLCRYDKKRGVRLEELKTGDLFKLNGKIFVKGKKLRSRFECEALPLRKKYRVLGLAAVEKIEKHEHEW